MLYVGLDVHERLSVISILDESGREVKSRQIKGRWPKLLEVLGQLSEPYAICYEASIGYGHLYDKLVHLAKRVVVAHPGQLRLIFRSKKKNDRVDARKLATLLFLDQVPEVHVPTIDVRSWRCLIEFRNRLIAKRTRVKNSIRSILRTYGIQAPGRSRLWSLKGLAWLKELDFPAPFAALQRDILIDELTELNGSIRKTEGRLDTIAASHPGVSLLRTIPGVGPRTAEATVAYIDNPHRFAKNKCIGSYFGIVPSQDQSAGRKHYGRITREGPATVRKLITEAAWRSIRSNSQMQAYFQRVQKDDPQRKKIALVATAHYLLRIMLTMLKTGEAWRTQEKHAA